MVTLWDVQLKFDKLIEVLPPDTPVIFKDSDTNRLYEVRQVEVADTPITQEIIGVVLLGVEQ